MGTPVQKDPGFTQQYNVTRLLYYETFWDIRDAIHREKQLKWKSKKKKIQLISEFNPIWADLYERI